MDRSSPLPRSNSKAPNRTRLEEGLCIGKYAECEARNCTNVTRNCRNKAQPIRAGNGLLGSAERFPNTGTKVNSLCPNPRLLIALYSPATLLKTQLRVGASEKSYATAILLPDSAFSAVEFCRATIAKNGPVLQIS
jgi:hypothetical protein